jgi:DNA-binding NtrC family response regulator
MDELQKTCSLVQNLGITRMLCAHSYNEAVSVLSDTNNEIDIVIADFELEAGKALGVLLCSTFKMKYPGVSFILVSKEYSCSVAIQMLSGKADDLLDKRENAEVQENLVKWVELAKERNKTRETING